MSMKITVVRRKRIRVRLTLSETQARDLETAMWHAVHTPGLSGYRGLPLLVRLHEVLGTALNAQPEDARPASTAPEPVSRPPQYAVVHLDKPEHREQET